MLSVIECLFQQGIMIGCYYRQWFANVILQPLDHALREMGFRVKHYIRYMDNFTIFSPNKRKLKRAVEYVKEWLIQHGMKMKSNWQVFPG